MNSTESDKRQAYISGLRRLANALEVNPDLSIPASTGENQYSPLAFWFYGDDAKQMIVKAARALGLKKYKKNFDENTFSVSAELDGVHVAMYAQRDQVCTSKVVGKKLVERTVVTASEKRMIEVDDIVWECPQLLANEEARS